MPVKMPAKMPTNHIQNAVETTCQNARENARKNASKMTEPKMNITRLLGDDTTNKLVYLQDNKRGKKSERRKKKLKDVQSRKRKRK